MIKNAITIALLTQITQSKTIEHSFTNLKVHTNQALKITPDASGITNTNDFLFFIGAWVKAKTGPSSQKIVLHGVADTSITDLLLALSHKKCYSVTLGTWIFLIQNFKLKSANQYLNHGYFRNSGSMDFECQVVGSMKYAPGTCKACNEYHLAHVFGEEFRYQADGFKINLNQDSAQKMTGIVSGFARLKKLPLGGNPYYTDEIASVVMSGRAVEIPEHRVYLGNFDFENQKHLFVQNSAPEPVGEGKINSEGIFSSLDYFYSKFTAKGLKMDHVVYHLIRKNIGLFWNGVNSLARSFCFKTRLIGFKGPNFKPGAEFNYSIRVGLEETSSVVITFNLQHEKHPTDQSQIGFKVRVFSIFDNDPTDHHELPGSDVFWMEKSVTTELAGAFCLKLIPSKYSTPPDNQDTNSFLISISSRFFVNDGTGSLLFPPRSGGFDTVLTVQYPYEDPMTLKGSMQMKWSCLGIKNCEDYHFHMVYYREFSGGYTNYFLEESQKATNKQDRMEGMRNMLHCLMAMMGTGSDPLCVFCKWHLSFEGGTCEVDKKKAIKDCSYVQEINPGLCQQCGEDSFARAIATASCEGERACKGPEFNRYSENRCDYCGLGGSNHCRCNRYQKEVDYPGKAGKKTCECKVKGCKKIILSFNFDLFFCR